MFVNKPFQKLDYTYTNKHKHTSTIDISAYANYLITLSLKFVFWDIFSNLTKLNLKQIHKFYIIYMVLTHIQKKAHRTNIHTYLNNTNEFMRIRETIENKQEKKNNIKNFRRQFY